MENLINSIPKEHSYIQSNGETVYQGFVLRWSRGRQKWLCGYGVKTRPDNLGKFFVEADDPVEALAFFAELLSQRTS